MKNTNFLWMPVLLILGMLTSTNALANGANGHLHIGEEVANKLYWSPYKTTNRIIAGHNEGNWTKFFSADELHNCQRRSKSLPLGRSKSRPVCLIFGYVFWPLQGPEDIVRH